MSPLIVQAASFHPPYGGNFLASLKAVASACKSIGWRTLFAFPAEAAGHDWTAQLSADGFQVRFLPAEASVLDEARALAGFVSKEQASLIHTHFTRYDVPGYLTRHFMKEGMGRPNVLWHLHSDFPVRMTPMRRLKNLLKFRVMGASVRMVAVSEHLRRKTIDAGFDASNIQTIPNAIDLQRVSNSVRSREQVFSALDIPSAKRLLLLFGWSPHVKGVDIAIDAVAGLVRQGESVVLGIVGTDDLRRFVAKRMPEGLPSWLRLLPPTDQVADLLHAASVFLSASRNEGFSYSVCEAMAAGTPVVLSDIPAMAWAQAAPGAVSFAPGDPVSLSQSIRVILSRAPGESQALAGQCRQFVKEHHDVRIWAGKILGVYQHMLSGKGAP
jgi:glycosyltransferase involved in cell wall biosynthesis